MNACLSRLFCLLALAALLGLSLNQAFCADAPTPLRPPPPPEPKRPPAKVVIYEDQSLVNKFQVNEARAADALDATIMQLMGETTPAKAWAKIVSPGQKVSVHFTATGDPALTPPIPVLVRVIQRLNGAGIPPENITLWDKFEDSLFSSGINPGSTIGGIKVSTVVPGAGFDPQVFYFNEVVGKLIWGDFEFVGKKESIADIAAKALEKENAKNGLLPPPKKEDSLTEQISNRSHFTKLVTQADRVINIAVMTDHPDLGIYGACASLAMASVDNNRRFFAANTRGDPAIGEILSHTALKDKVPLHIVLGLIPQYAGGPVFRPHYTLPAGLILASQDPVALDSVCLYMMEQWRIDKTVIPIGDLCVHLKPAARLYLGTDKLTDIKIERIGKPTADLPLP